MYSYFLFKLIYLSQEIIICNELTKALEELPESVSKVINVNGKYVDAESDEEKKKFASGSDSPGHTKNNNAESLKRSISTILDLSIDIVSSPKRGAPNISNFRPLSLPPRQNSTGSHDDPIVLD